MDEDLLVLMHYLSTSSAEKMRKVSALRSLANLEEKLEQLDLACAEATRLADMVEELENALPLYVVHVDPAAQESETVTSVGCDGVEISVTDTVELDDWDHWCPGCDGAEYVRELRSENAGLLQMVKEAEEAAGRAEHRADLNAEEVERLNGVLDTVAMCLGYVPRRD
jgi:hypothetical protein